MEAPLSRTRRRRRTRLRTRLGRLADESLGHLALAVRRLPDIPGAAVYENLGLTRFAGVGNGCCDGGSDVTADRRRRHVLEHGGVPAGSDLGWLQAHRPEASGAHERRWSIDAGVHDFGPGDTRLDLSGC